MATVHANEIAGHSGPGVEQRGEDSRDALVALGHPVQWHSYSMQHSVHPRELADISAFLAQVLGKAS